MIDGNKIILSVTSYSKRVHRLKLHTLESIAKQDIAYDVLRVNLQDDIPEELFEDAKKYAESLDKRVEVVKTDSKWRSCNKLLPTMKSYPDAIIFTFDDDNVYPENYSTMLYEVWERHKKCIICHETNGIVVLKGGIPLYTYGFFSRVEQESYDKFLSNCTLFPPNWHGGNEELYNYENMMKCTNGTHDELWFWIFATMARTKSVSLFDTAGLGKDYGLEADDCALFHINSSLDVCRSYMKTIIDMYGRKICPILANDPVVFHVNKKTFPLIFAAGVELSAYYQNCNLWFLFEEDCLESYYKPIGGKYKKRNNRKIILTNIKDNISITPQTK